ncbi:MAG: AfsR/SARP family transcriptional regulator, partial [Hyphomicrobiales bacterium]
MTVLRLALLGGFEFRMACGTGIDVPRRKSRALLAYLAMHRGEAVPRDRLASLLWGDGTDAQARGNLRKTLSRLKQALPENARACLDAGPKLVRLRLEQVEVDAVRFEDLTGQGTPEALARAAALWRGPFLELQADCGGAFEDWLTLERRRLEERVRGVLAKLLDHHMVIGAVEAAVEAALALLAIDPLQEDVHRKLMRLYAVQGRIGSAARQYQ